MPTPTKTRRHRARLEQRRQKQQTAQAHSDHMNNDQQRDQIVTKSMPPSRKLIAMNGAIAANSVASFTPCARSLPITTRRGRQRRQRDELERLLHPLVAQRAERAERHHGQAEKRQAAHQRQERPAAGRAASGERVRGAKERDGQPGDQAGAERVAELPSAARPGALP